MLYDALHRGSRDVRFTFLSAEIIDRSRAPGTGSLAVALAPVVLSATAQAPPVERALTAPPARFKSTPLVRALFDVYEVATREPRVVTAAGNFVLSAVKTRVRGLAWPERGIERTRRVAETLNVAPAILELLHDLSTETGDITTARKVTDKAELDRPRRAHTVGELTWVCEAMRLLTLRLGEWEAEPNELARLELDAWPPSLE